MTDSIRTLGLIDLPVLALHSRRVYPNQAVTFEHGQASHGLRPGPLRLLRACLLPGHQRQIWVARDGATLLGVAALRRRGGRSAWEIDTLITTAPNEAFLLDLLDRAVATAGSDGAHRLFLRLSTASPALEQARRHGFVVVTEETLFGASQPLPMDTLPMDTPPQRARRRIRADDDALFRLYSQAVPQEVRWQTALAPAEWRAALEPLGRNGAEWVLPSDDAGAAAALVRLGRAADGSRVSVLTDGRPQTVNAALALAHARARKERPLQILVPNYAVSTMHTAAAIGMEPVATYVLLVRPIAQRARRLQLAERAVKGIVRPAIQ